LLLELEEGGDDAEQVSPVSGVVGLHEELAAGNEGLMDQGEECWCQESSFGLGRRVERLGMVAVNFGKRVGRDVALEEFASADEGESEISQSALVAPPCGVTKDHGKDVDPKVVVVGPPDGTVNEEAAIATSHVEDDGGMSAEKRVPVQRASIGKALQGSARPLRRFENLSRERNAELAFDAPASWSRLTACSRFTFHGVSRVSVVYFAVSRLGLFPDVCAPGRSTTPISTAPRFRLH
jgi:hypothetical protein